MLHDRNLHKLHEEKLRLVRIFLDLFFTYCIGIILACMLFLLARQKVHFRPYPFLVNIRKMKQALSLLNSLDFYRLCLLILPFVKTFYALLKVHSLGSVLIKNSCSLRKVYQMALKSNGRPFIDIIFT